MASLLIHLRQRAISQSTTGSRQSDSSVPPEVSPSVPSDQPPTDQQNENRPSLARKIYPDISGLLNSYSSHSSGGSSGLKPPRSRKRSTAVPEQEEQTNEDISPSLDISGFGQDVCADADTLGAVPTQSTHRRRLARFAPQRPIGGWSTFGRNKDQDSPPVARFTPPPSDKHFRMNSTDSSIAQTGRSTNSRAGRSSKYSSDAISLNPQANRSRVSMKLAANQSVSSSISKGSSVKYSNDDSHDYSHHTPSPVLTTSSRQNSTNKSSGSHSSPSAHHHRHSFIHSESPRTFGTSTPNIGFDSEFVTPPPPLPPLNHPELVAALASRSQINVTVRSGISTPTPSRRQRWSATVHGKTYPPRGQRRRRHKSEPDENTVPFPHQPPRRSLRGFASLPKVRELLTLYSQSDESPSSTRSSSLETRLSARRSAKQPSVIVSNMTKQQQQQRKHETWHAEVSREILRLSLGEDIMSGSVKGKGSASAEPHGQHVPGGSSRRTQTRHLSFSPLPSPSFTSSTLLKARLATSLLKLVAIIWL
ncbi:hypothetical protein C8Q75DRAFT_327181 [Abortiporus biennis]|nr:hypothetical protein C8Q75DRAFT_327181 [Abortiporus biennis]